MGKATGFLEHERLVVTRRAPSERLGDYREFDEPVSLAVLADQGARCMNCGVPFCNTGCPLGNLIPDWNDAVYRGALSEASAALHATNNFPEVTGRVCPAPCESACVLGINAEPVAIKVIERTIAERAFEAGLVAPEPAARRTGKRVAIVGSGPAGLATAQQLARVGHDVTVFERDDRIGGLLRYGIPDFKLEKHVLDRRIEQLASEGVVFKTGVHVGVTLSAEALRAAFDAVVLAGGSRVPRDLAVPGRELSGVHFAMEFLAQQNRRVAGDSVPASEAILATGKHVVVVGGGDTGSDCIGTSLRQGAASVTSLEILPRPPDERPAETPWPLWPNKLRTSTSHEEGGTREWGVATERLTGDAEGRVRELHSVRVELRAGRPEKLPGTERVLQADLVLIAMGFLYPERAGLLQELGCELTERGNVRTDARCMTSVPGVFAAGDMQRGQSLVVWCIAEGRRAARAVDEYLQGESQLPVPGRAGLLR